MTFDQTSAAIIPRHVRARSLRRSSLPMLLMLAAVAACGDPEEPVAARQDLNTLDIKDLDPAGAALIIDGSEDADAMLRQKSLPNIPNTAAGDVDGDGCADWLTFGRSLVYGGARPAPGGIFEAASINGFGGSGVEGNRNVSVSPVPLGDIDGDGRRDLGLSASLSGPIPSGPPSGTAWSEPVVFIRYGALERSATLASETELGHPNPGAFPASFPTDVPPEELESYVGDQNLDLHPLGDIDGDGFDDFALSVIDKLNLQEGDDYIVQSASVASYLIYGGSARINRAAQVFESAARLADVEWMAPIGDVDGDGYADAIAALTDAQTGYRLHVVFGSANRRSGPLDITTFPAITTTAFTYQATGLGDLDGDGYADFTVRTSEPRLGELQETDYIFYGTFDLSSQALSTQYADASFSITITRPAYAIPLGDFNADGFDDLVVGTGDRALIWPGSAERLRGRYRGPADARPAGIAILHGVGDIDGDGFADLTFEADGSSPSPISSAPIEGYIKYGGPVAANAR